MKTMSISSNGPQPLPLSREFFDRPTLKVAKELLGKYLMRETPAGVIHTQIMDVECLCRS